MRYVSGSFFLSEEALVESVCTPLSSIRRWIVVDAADHYLEVALDPLLKCSLFVCCSLCFDVFLRGKSLV